MFGQQCCKLHRKYMEVHDNGDLKLYVDTIKIKLHRLN